MWLYGCQAPNELYHYGVLGMKWGVRRSRVQLSKASKRKNRIDDRSDDAKEAAKISSKKVHQMSNAELKKLNERTQLERNYSNLNPSKVKRGLTAAAGIAAAMGTVATLYTNSSKLIDIGSKIAKNMDLDKIVAKRMGVY